MAYTGMADLDTGDTTDGACFFRVSGPDVQTMALLGRGYILSCCTGTAGVLSEKEGALYRVDGHEVGWTLEQKASGAQREGDDTITADITLEYNEPAPGARVLQKEAGSWKIADISL